MDTLYLIHDDTIYYTVDGSNPSMDSPVYGDPIVLESELTVKARTASSGISQLNYIIGDAPEPDATLLGYGLDTIGYNGDEIGYAEV